MSKGLRQGCPIAPLIYLAWSVRFLRQVNASLGDRWDLSHATVYADDKHLSWEIDGASSLSRAVKELGTVLRILRGLGMEISFGKCEAVLSVKGHRGTGLDSRGLRLVESTVAQQLRKVLRTHERGVSNREVFTRADLDPRVRLEGVFASQYKRIAGVVRSLLACTTEPSRFWSTSKGSLRLLA